MSCPAHPLSSMGENRSTSNLSQNPCTSVLMTDHNSGFKTSAVTCRSWKENTLPFDVHSAGGILFFSHLLFYSIRLATAGNMSQDGMSQCSLAVHSILFLEVSLVGPVLGALNLGNFRGGRKSVAGTVVELPLSTAGGTSQRPIPSDLGDIWSHSLVVTV